MDDLALILKRLFGRHFPRFGTITLKISVIESEINHMTLEDITLSQHFKPRELPQSVGVIKADSASMSTK